MRKEKKEPYFDLDLTSSIRIWKIFLLLTNYEKKLIVTKNIIKRKSYLWRSLSLSLDLFS